MKYQERERERDLNPGLAFGLLQRLTAPGKSELLERLGAPGESEHVGLPECTKP